LSNFENTLFDTKILQISPIKALVTFCCYGNKNSLATKSSVAITQVLRALMC